MTEGNIIYIKLLHELKADFPHIPDEIVKLTIQKFGKDKDSCIKDLTRQSSLLMSSGIPEEGASSRRGKETATAIVSSAILVTPSSIITSSTSSTTAIVQSMDGSSSKCTRSCRENPYRKVFTKRKMFYQKFCNPEGLEEDRRFFSSSNLVWRRKCSLCETNEDDKVGKKTADQNSSFITLNANIQPFAPFVIRHDSEGTTPGALTLLSSVSHNDSSGHSTAGSSLGANSDKMEVSLDGGNVHYATSAINSEEGVESHLEVSLGRTESFITTRHTKLDSSSNLTNNLSNSSSSIFHLQYEDGGKILNITSNFNNSQSPESKKRPAKPRLQSRPASLNLNTLFYSSPATRPASAYCTQLSNPVISPRYNSLPDLSHYGWKPYGYFLPDEYQPHPADEEKRLAYTRALLAHQMEQCLKLDLELRQEKKKLNLVREEVSILEERVNHRKLLRMNSIVKRNESLEKDIKSLRHSCDTMAARVTKITKGKVALGETNLKFYKSLSPTLSDNKRQDMPDKATPVGIKEPLNDLSNPRGSPPYVKKLSLDKPVTSASSPASQWACTECTFLNHPALIHCEECEMPRILINSPSKEDLHRRTPSSFVLAKSPL